MRQDGLSIPGLPLGPASQVCKSKTCSPFVSWGELQRAGEDDGPQNGRGGGQGKLCHGLSHIFICRKDFLQGETSASAASGEKLTAVARRGHWLQPAAGRSPWDSDQVSSVSSAQDTVPPIAPAPDGGLHLSTIVTNVMRRMPSGPGRSAPQRGRAAGSALEDAPPSISSRPTPTS